MVVKKQRDGERRENEREGKIQRERRGRERMHSGLFLLLSL